MYVICNVVVLCQQGRVRVTLLARSTEYRQIINQQEVNLIDLSFCFLKLTI